ncbi:hypothetical protein ACSBL2_18285 [Pedobacter sp. AW31-3R]|uniref:hypothetical protein n=1 Tax=Pedobacter sp. AW31-3R TaxID=3445781 RepID=UPI003FA14F52
MKTIKFFCAILLFSIFSLAVQAQDAVVIDTGDFVRGTIQGTDYMTVSIKDDNNGELKTYKAKDIKEFLWNGMTFVSKPFVTNKKTDYRFFKLVESGKVNLYSMGGTLTTEKPKRNRLRIVPSIGIGIGTGGFGSGIGLGGGVSFGGGRNNDDEPQRQARRSLIYIDKAGSPEMLEITPSVDQTNAGMEYIKNSLLEKFADDNNISARVKDMDKFDVKSIQALVKAYNSVHK